VLSYVLRRIGVSILIIVAASFLMYTLVALARIPLQDLYASNSPEQGRAASRSASSGSTSISRSRIRWFNWLLGVHRCAIPFGGCDLGVTIQNQEVTTLLARAMSSTMQLVTGLGHPRHRPRRAGRASSRHCVSTARSTTASPSRASSSTPCPPSSWVSLLKVFVALGFNNWLVSPVFTWPWIIGLSALSGVFWMAIIGGKWQRRLIVFGLSVVITGAMLYSLSVTAWVLNPSLGPVVGPLLIGAFGAAMVLIIAGPRARYAWRTAGATIIALVAAYFLLQPFLPSFELWGVVLLFVLAGVVGAAAGWFLGEYDKGQAMRIGALTGLLGMGVIIVDQYMQTWNSYISNPKIRGRPIPTIGSETPNLVGDFWIQSTDTFMHLLLPTISLMLISFAGYTATLAAACSRRSTRITSAPRAPRACRAHGRRTACLPQLADPHHDGDRDRHRRSHRRSDHHGADLRLQRHGRAVQQRTASGGSEPGDGLLRRHRRLRDHLQLPRRSRVLGHRSESEGQVA
jgi:peptide/nickel transport system permease protein